jgi:SP family general alpha glucoside:H+ symporter-like MFS transporter
LPDFIRLPETKGRSFEELDMLFNNGVPARKFKTYEVDAYNEQLVQETVVTRQSSVA